MSSSQASLGQTIDARENVPAPGTPPPAAPVNSLDQGIAMSENGNNVSITQSSYWNGNPENMQQRVRSPTMQVSDACKLRHCMNVQCGRGFEGMPISANGSCPRPQTMYYQSVGLPMRVQHNHHHHPASGPPCHPHQSQQTLGPFPNLQTPHSPLDRMMHNSSANQVRSVVMNHYASNSGCLHHNGTPGTGPGYFPQSSSSAPGVPVNGSSYLEYSHHNHHHHGPGMSTAGNSSGSYRMAAAHHHKMINPNHAAALAAYQNVYHQYTQYFHHQGMMHAFQNQQGGTSEYAVNQNMMQWGGIPMNGGPSSMSHLQQGTHQPPACMFPYMNRMGNGQPVSSFQSHHHRHHHHHSFSACHPQMVSNCMIPNQHHSHAQNRTENGVLQNQPGSPLDSSKTDTKSSSLSESQSRKESVKELHSKKNRKGSSIKTGSSKVSSTSSEKSAKAKAAKSLTRLRERQPRLVVGQKKKSLLNISGNGNSRKHKSVSKTGSVIAGFLSCKHATGSGTDSGASRVVKRSKLSPKKDSDDDMSETSCVSSSTTSGKSDDEQSKPEEDMESKEQEFDRYCLEETLDEEYVPTPEEMIEYLERLNTCSSLNIPLHHAYSVFHENGMDKDSSDCSVDECVDGVIHESECLNCLTWQQQQYDICPSRPPPGFEHLSRPAFPIELYDPSLLGSLIGSQMPRGSAQATSPDSYFDDIQEVLTSLTCCEKHAIDKIWNMKKTSAKLHEGVSNLDGSDCDWDNLDKAIRNVLDDWTEELYFRKKVQQILFGLNLHEVYGGCCKTSASEESSNISEKSTFGFTPLITREEQSQIRYFIEDSIL